MSGPRTPPAGTIEGARDRGRRPSLTALLAWYAAALAVVDLLFFSGASNFLPSPQARILTQLIVGGAALAWVAVAWRAAGRGGATAGPWSDPVATPLLLPGLAWAAVQLLSAATSQRPASSLEAAALLLLALPGYLVVRAALRHRVLRPRLDWLLVVATLLFLLAYLWQVLDQWLAWWGAVGPSVPPLRPADVGLTVGTANAVAVHAELLVAPAAWIAWRRWHRRPLPLLILVLGAATLLISASRGGWVGTAAGIAMVVASRVGHGQAGRGVAGRGWSGRSSSSRPTGILDGLRARPSRALATIAGLAVLAALAVVAGPALATRLFSSDAGRGELWGAGIQVWLAHPLLGGGPGAWPGLRAETDISIASYAVLYTPHSSLVQVLAETGIAGLVASIALVAAVGRLAWRTIRSAATRAARIEREIAAGALLALLVHSLVDPMFHIPAVVLMTLLLVARLEVGLEDDARASRAAEGGTPDVDAAESSAPVAGRAGLLASPRARLAVALLPVVAGAALLVPIDGAMLDGQRGMDALDAGRPADALAAFDRAVAAHDLAPYRVGQGIARASLGDSTGAIAALRAAQAQQPFSFIAAQIAWLQAPTDASGSVATAREAIQAGVYDPAANLNVAIVLARSGGTTEATALLATVFQDVPELIHSARPALIAADLWDAARAIALAEIRLKEPGRAVLEELRAGLADRAATDLAALPAGPERRLLEQVRAAEAGAAPDMAAARADLRGDRANPVAMAAFDRLARLAGSQADIRLVQVISIALRTDVPPPDREIRFDGSPQDRLVWALPRWPMASDSRLGPRRPFLPGMATIQVVR